MSPGGQPVIMIRTAGLDVALFSSRPRLIFPPRTSYCQPEFRVAVPKFVAPRPRMECRSAPRQTGPGRRAWPCPRSSGAKSRGSNAAAADGVRVVRVWKCSSGVIGQAVRRDNAVVARYRDADLIAVVRRSAGRGRLRRIQPCRPARTSNEMMMRQSVFIGANSRLFFQRNASTPAPPATRSNPRTSRRIPRRKFPSMRTSGRRTASTPPRRGNTSCPWH